MAGAFSRLFRFLIVLLLVAATWDFVRFTDRAARSVETVEHPSAADAIVVLTGGGARIAKAAELAHSDGLPLFISGVHPDSSGEDVALAAGVDPAFFECCVTLGRQAQTTAQNGFEIAQWAAQEGHNAIVVVTSNYHIERAVLEMRRSMPEADLHPYPVESPTINAKRWWSDLKSTRRMLIEWVKWRVITISQLL